MLFLIFWSFFSNPVWFNFKRVSISCEKLSRYVYVVYNSNHGDNLIRSQTKVLGNEIVYHQPKITIDF